MTSEIPKNILDDLTDVAMPRLPPEAAIPDVLDAAGARIPVLRCGCVVVGSGAAGLRAAVELKRRGGDVVIISQSAWGGTSACSGSDKQTLHTANTSDQGDNYKAMARAIRGGGAMDEDTAYIEAVGSGRAMASLQYLGLPLPQDRLGGTLRYQTDHDEVGRATSCGPRTSRLMVTRAGAGSDPAGDPVLQPDDRGEDPDRGRPHQGHSGDQTRLSRRRQPLGSGPVPMLGAGAGGGRPGGALPRQRVP